MAESVSEGSPWECVSGWSPGDTYIPASLEDFGVKKNYLSGIFFPRVIKLSVNISGIMLFLSEN